MLPWEDIAMDFIEVLPFSNQKNAILVVVDRLNKYDHLLALKHLYTAHDVANIFLNKAYKLHGMPKTIV